LIDPTVVLAEKTQTLFLSAAASIIIIVIHCKPTLLQCVKSPAKRF
jgi:hypothetical protein